MTQLSVPKNRNRRKIASVFKSQSANRKFYCRNRRKSPENRRKNRRKSQRFFGVRHINRSVSAFSKSQRFRDAKDPKICHKNEGSYGVKIPWNKGTSTENVVHEPTFMAYELRLLWHTNPLFYAIWTVFVGGWGWSLACWPLKPSWIQLIYVSFSCLIFIWESRMGGFPGTCLVTHPKYPPPIARQV